MDAALNSNSSTSTDVGGAPAEPSLKRRTIHGSAWTIGGYAFQHALKLASNVILARLLFPEAFGVMALVNSLIQGLQMFSDVGIEPSIIQSKRADEPKFLNTAWTLQVIRGFGLFLAACAVAWPFTEFYADSPEYAPFKSDLLMMIPVAALTALFAGFNATNMVTLNRHLKLKERMLFDLVLQVCNIGSTIVLAWVYRSVWALVAGNVIEALLRVMASHVVLPGIRNGFAWDKSCVHELIRFGRWIFLGTVLGFLMQFGDRLILGKLMSPTDLGLYAIALGFSQMVVKAMRQFSGRVLFPLYARLQEDDPDRLRSRMFRVRGALLLCALPPVCVLAVIAQPVVDVLYTSDYHEAGWMLRILAIGGVASIIGLTISPVLLAAGDSLGHLIAMTLQAGGMVACVVVGGVMHGPVGVIVGITVSKFLTYPVNAAFAYKHGVWMPKLDGLAFAGCGVVVAGGCWLLP